MTYLFVDTNVYVGVSFDVGGSFFRKLIDYCNHDVVKFLSCSICENEVKVHIKDDLGNALRERYAMDKKTIFFAVKIIQNMLGFLC